MWTDDAANTDCCSIMILHLHLPVQLGCLAAGVWRLLPLLHLLVRKSRPSRSGSHDHNLLQCAAPPGPCWLGACVQMQEVSPALGRTQGTCLLPKTLMLQSGMQQEHLRAGLSLPQYSRGCRPGPWLSSVRHHETSLVCSSDTPGMHHEHLPLSLGLTSTQSPSLPAHYSRTGLHTQAMSQFL